MDKHSSLFCREISDSDDNSFSALTPGANVIKLFTAVSYEFMNKIELLFLAGLSSLALCLHVRSGAYPRVICSGLTHKH
jgi:hypothetical protein